MKSDSFFFFLETIDPQEFETLDDANKSVLRLEATWVHKKQLTGLLDDLNGC